MIAAWRMTISFGKWKCKICVCMYRTRKGIYFNELTFTHHWFDSKIRVGSSKGIENGRKKIDFLKMVKHSYANHEFLLKYICFYVIHVLSVWYFIIKLDLFRYFNVLILKQACYNCNTQPHIFFISSCLLLGLWEMLMMIMVVVVGVVCISWSCSHVVLCSNEISWPHKIVNGIDEFYFVLCYVCNLYTHMSTTFSMAIWMPFMT